ncbi:LOW QUALITY PROTEIN: major facilitator superfamily domain-containing protein 12-like [Pomacea canaliculata]|uniref:LOW QUALITY PROTEIN: major facilitator superfamily domain-containing protein 12-like n=1 Tax=Pomacea canaliculata TaxID=400727 RepID=UPI000D739C28|nr:LOW QUALITY PROTEIN: major facilitator superfamily domain-containing protein 12-like [Pomacea canaliculata]
MPVEEGWVPYRLRLAYSVGHIQNDLHASVWFSYFLLYLHQVKNFNNIWAGTLLLLGQVVDAIATPLIGYESDNRNGCCNYGKRKSWHLFGTSCLLHLAFTFIFIKCINCTNETPDYVQFIYYGAFVIIFQIGWASVQISHLSLIPELTSCENQKTGLIGWRYAATGFSSLLTYAIAWVLLSAGSNAVTTDDLGPGDSDSFRNLALIATGTGLFFSVIFSLGSPEPKRMEDELRKVTDEDGMASVERSMLLHDRKRTICSWFKDIRFYQVALVYMCTRLYVNMSQVYLPIYLTETMKLDKTSIANVPLVCYGSSFLTSIVIKMVDRNLGRKLSYLIGTVIALGASTLLYFIPSGTLWMVYLAAVIIGIGGSLMLVTSLSIVADLIGNSTDSGAFVYGAMSFTDKLANGIAVEIIQIFHPCVACCPACGPYYRHILSFVPGGSAFFALVGLAWIVCTSARTRASAGPALLHDPTSGLPGSSYLEENKITSHVNGSVPTDSDASDSESAPLIQKNLLKSSNQANGYAWITKA